MTFGINYEQKLIQICCMHWIFHFKNINYLSCTHHPSCLWRRW